MTTLVYTPAPESKKRNLFEVCISYEHGDADCTTECTQTLNCNEEEFKAYLERFDMIQKLIDEARSTGESIDDLESLCRVDNLYVPAEYDTYAKMHMSGYYASMCIMHITWFDENGNKFNVDRVED